MSRGSLGWAGSLVLCAILMAFSGCGSGERSAEPADSASAPKSSEAPSERDEMVLSEPAEEVIEVETEHSYSVAGPENGAAAGESEDRDYTVVPVFFATDRDLTGEDDPGEVFGVGRGGMSYGVSEVSIPDRHVKGELDSPSWWRLEFWESPERHIVLLNVDRQEKDAFFDGVAARVAESDVSRAFVFVHGYSVTFEDAARRTAQIAYDIGFRGAPVFYSWPSQGTKVGYPIDVENVAWSEANLIAFLEEFFDRSAAEEIHLVAHSMGNRALAGAVDELFNTKRPDLRPRLREVILTAPDIDADVFKRDIAPALAETARPVTLYASANDKALWMSEEYNGNPRAGDANDGIIVAQGIETVDATRVDSSFFSSGHLYYGSSRLMLRDLLELVRMGKRAEERRWLQSVNAEIGRYWEFSESDPE